MKTVKLIKKFQRVKANYGFATAIGRVFHFIGNIEGRRARRLDIKKAKCMKGDVLFINGCPVEHPARYRVLHQMEQLALSGLISSKVYFEDIEIGMEANFKTFIFYRCEYTTEVEAFIKRAKEHNKRVCFDVDDLVIDTKYTNLVPFVKSLLPRDKKLFDQSVVLTGKTLAACDIAVTTTEELAKELGRVVSKTHINRNTASQEMVVCSEIAYQKHCLKEKANSNHIWIGYFSGSLTHNKDFSIVHKALIRILEKHKNVGLLLAGELDSSDELQIYSNRIVKKNTVGWRELPALIVEADINLAPLEDTLFNQCKSEIKWIEAALVRVPTVASKIGAFDRMIEDGVTGILCDNITDVWYNKLESLIINQNKRKEIANNAYSYVIDNCTTSGTADEYKDFITKAMENSDDN